MFDKTKKQNDSELLKAIFCNDPFPDFKGRELLNGLMLLIGSSKENILNVRDNALNAVNKYAEGSCVLTSLK